LRRGSDETLQASFLCAFISPLVWSSDSLSRPSAASQPLLLPTYPVCPFSLASAACERPLLSIPTRSLFKFILTRSLKISRVCPSSSQLQNLPNSAKSLSMPLLWFPLDSQQSHSRQALASLERIPPPSYLFYLFFRLSLECVSSRRD